ncbi:MAG: glycosyltransferase family 2 protein [Bacteroidaceae bacterium]|nr:glycosyltransferase family 2 protein [Bacteroidaceae bacterium]
MTKLPVILLNYNSSADCRKCVCDLKRQQGVELEIIIVDNCSRKEEADAIKKLAEENQCTYIPATENRGYNAGNNIGLRYAATKGYEYALIANPDMLFPETNYISRLFSEIRHHSDIAIAASDITSPQVSHQNPMIPDPESWTSGFAWIKTIMPCPNKKTDSNIGDYKTTHFCKKVSGCCFLVSMNFVKDIDFFDENVFLYCEEAILSKLVEKHNKKILYLADICAVHNHIKATKGNARKHFKAWISSRLYFERKYNYQNPHSHFLKIIGWKSYLIMFCLKDYFRNIITATYK